LFVAFLRVFAAVLRKPCGKKNLTAKLADFEAARTVPLPILQTLFIAGSSGRHLPLIFLCYCLKTASLQPPLKEEIHDYFSQA
jgi:hypothetical protein